MTSKVLPENLYEGVLHLLLLRLDTQSGSLSANKYALGTGEVISITDVLRTQAIIKLTKDPKTKRA